MNYGQFLYMLPEYVLVLALIIVFAFDFAMTKSGELRGEKSNVALGRLTWFMLMSVGSAIFSVMRMEDTITAFGGMYVATQHPVGYVCDDVIRQLPAVLPRS